VKVAVFSTKPYDERFLEAANVDGRHELTFLEARLSARTAPLAAGHRGVCAFVNDQLDRPALEVLTGLGVDALALRSAGFNHVDLEAARKLGVTVARVPAYSPTSVAEHAVGLMLALNRQIHRAHARVREGNFALDGLLGFDLSRRTAGVVGTGKIGAAVCRILLGFGCRVLAADPYPRDDLTDAGVEYVDRDELLREANVVTLHCPLTPDTHHLIDHATLEQMRPGVMLINTSRGALVDTAAVIGHLKTGKVGYVGLDVYEEEADLFFEDLSDRIIQDDVFSRLQTFPNVIVTGHQAFFTEEALTAIAEETIDNLTAMEEGAPSGNEL
jgi:D-lactate dehydrogenase